jgi:hypothetical protein
MNQKEFFQVFNSVAHNYKWVHDNGIIRGYVTRGKYKGREVNPVTAVARSLGKGYFTDNYNLGGTSGTYRAGIVLGITSQLSLAIIQACYSRDVVNGHATVIRGKILNFLVFSKLVSLQLR